MVIYLNTENLKLNFPPERRIPAGAARTSGTRSRTLDRGERERARDEAREGESRQGKWTAVGGCEAGKNLRKPLIYKAQMKDEGIPARGHHRGYPKTLKGQSLPGGIVFEEVL